MACNKEKEIIINVVDMYKDMPYLWDKSHKDYLNKAIRSEGFKVLVEIYKNFDETATPKLLKKKLENMRTNYAKELKKVIASKQTGAGAGEMYIPSLWYFDSLSFLRSRTEACRIATDTLENENSSSSEDDGPSQRRASVATGSGYPPKKKKRDTLIQRQQNVLMTAERLMSNREEEWEVFGRSIGLQMKDLNKRQMTIAQKIISDVIFYAKLDKLSDDSSVVIRPLIEHRSNISTFYQRQRQPSYHFTSPLSQNTFYSPDMSPSSSHSPPSLHQVQSPHHPSPSSHNHPSSHSSPSPRYQAQLVHQPSLFPQQQVQSHYTSQSSQHQDLPPHHPSPSPHTITVNCAEDLLDYLPDNSKVLTENSSLNKIEGPGDLMKDFLIFKPKKK